MAEFIKLESPADVRALIQTWVNEVNKTGKLPFEQGGVVVQLLQVWLKSYEVQKVEEIEERISILEATKQNGGY
jgi:hypothetical protein